MRFIGKKKSIYLYSTYRSLLCNDGIFPKAYVLPKIHEQDCPFRITVSSIKSPLLTVFLHSIIIKTIPKVDNYVENSFKLIKEFDSRQLNNDVQLMLASSLTFPLTAMNAIDYAVSEIILFLEIVVYLKRNSSKWFSLF